jgi:hypothetical protein
MKIESVTASVFTAAKTPMLMLTASVFTATHHNSL